MSKLSRFSLKRKMDEINYFYSDMFSLNFDNLYSTVDLESHDMKENDTVVEVDNTLNRPSERAVLTETNMETNNLPAPDESRFPLSSNEQIQETVKQAENKNTNRSTATWMKVWSSWAKSRNIDVNMETFGARNFGRGLENILRGSKKTRWLRVRTGLSQSHASGPGEILIHTRISVQHHK